MKYKKDKKVSKVQFYIRLVLIFQFQYNSYSNKFLLKLFHYWYQYDC